MRNPGNGGDPTVDDQAEECARREAQAIGSGKIFCCAQAEAGLSFLPLID